ncbi:hypothetical protein CcaverHIS641_0502820 [Cutaneotrichosporon cavernicola]|nr:hypothetical protein CcaverHIS641_0502820 [Cutaneotrichosporon cavernicola]
MAYYPSMPAPYYGPYAYPQAYPQVQPMAVFPIPALRRIPWVSRPRPTDASYDPYMGTTPVAYEPCLATQVTAPAYYQPYMGATQYGSDAWWPHDRNPDQWYSNDRNGVYRPVRRFRDLLVRILS